MVKFIPVKPEDIPNVRQSHRGRVSYPILKSFLETGYAITMLDRTGMQQSLQALNSSLNAYIRSHELPVKLFMRKGQIYLARLDVDENTTLDEEGRTYALDIDRFDRRREQVGVAPQELLSDTTIAEVDDEEIDLRFADEVDQTTK